jgi:hypothetical protein
MIVRSPTNRDWHVLSYFSLCHLAVMTEFQSMGIGQQSALWCAISQRLEQKYASNDPNKWSLAWL